MFLFVFSLKFLIPRGLRERFESTTILESPGMVESTSEYYITMKSLSSPKFELGLQIRIDDFTLGLFEVIVRISIYS